MLLLAESKINIKGGVGYFLRTADGFRVLSADSLLEESGVVRRKIGISVSSGCQIGCQYCFTNKYSSYRRLSPDEIYEQVHFILDRNPAKPDQKLKISLKQMGDPVLNGQNVTVALGWLNKDFSKAMQVVSTSAPKSENTFFKDLQKLQDADADIRLQFSCHTTSDIERRILSPKMLMMSLTEIGEVANSWRGQKVTLNFVILAGHTYDVSVLEKIFSPEKVFIKVNYLDSNSQIVKNGFQDAAVSVKDCFVEALRKAGYQFAFRHK
jgi:adenine C2-methylase RlmN of 23S rRNA A2503 and tRNA A37